MPAKSNEKQSAAPNISGGVAFQWAKVGAKWVKVGADGQPFVPTPTAASSRPPPYPLDDDEHGEVERVTEDPLSRITDSSSSSKRDDQSSNCRVGTDAEAGGFTDGTGLPSSGSCATAGSWDRETPPPTSDEETGTHRLPNNDGLQARFGGAGGGGESSSASRGPEEDGAGGGRSVAGGSGGRSTGGLTVDANGDEKSAGVGGEQISRNPSRESMLTPGVSRTYSKDDVVGKFFGEDALARGGEPYGSGSSAACVGERAPPRGGDVRAAGRKGKPRRTGSGVSSPHRSSEPAKVVETRDVSCQWDGSECVCVCVFVFVMCFFVYHKKRNNVTFSLFTQ